MSNITTLNEELARSKFQITKEKVIYGISPDGLIENK
jgi:hypothetical protein